MSGSESQSKLATLHHFLEEKSANSDWPIVNKLRYVDDASAPLQSIELSLWVPEQLACFAGHFPTQAVLPGVVQIHWAGEFAKHLFPLDGFSTLQGCKFNSMVMPAMAVELSLSYNQEKASVKFIYSDEQTKFSLGTLIFSGNR